MKSRFCFNEKFNFKAEANCKLLLFVQKVPLNEGYPTYRVYG